MLPASTPLRPYRSSNRRPVFHVRVHSRSAPFARDGPSRLAGNARSLRPGALRDLSARPALRFCSALYTYTGRLGFGDEWATIIEARIGRVPFEAAQREHAGRGMPWPPMLLKSRP